jgi:hypothetical protein
MKLRRISRPLILVAAMACASLSRAVTDLACGESTARMQPRGRSWFRPGQRMEGNQDHSCLGVMSARFHFVASKGWRVAASFGYPPHSAWLSMM